MGPQAGNTEVGSPPRASGAGGTGPAHSLVLNFRSPELRVQTPAVKRPGACGNLVRHRGKPPRGPADATPPPTTGIPGSDPSERRTPPVRRPLSGGPFWPPAAAQTAVSGGGLAGPCCSAHQTATG